MRDIFAAEAAPTRNTHICEKIVRFNSARISIITGFLPAIDMAEPFAYTNIFVSLMPEGTFSTAHRSSVLS